MWVLLQVAPCMLGGPLAPSAAHWVLCCLALMKSEGLKASMLSSRIG